MISDKDVTELMNKTSRNNDGKQELLPYMQGLEQIDHESMHLVQHQDGLHGTPHSQVPTGPSKRETTTYTIQIQYSIPYMTVQYIGEIGTCLSVRIFEHKGAVQHLDERSMRLSGFVERSRK